MVVPLVPFSGGMRSGEYKHDGECVCALTFGRLHSAGSVLSVLSVCGNFQLQCNVPFFSMKKYNIFLLTLERQTVEMI